MSGLSFGWDGIAQDHAVTPTRISRWKSYGGSNQGMGGLHLWFDSYAACRFHVYGAVFGKVEWSAQAAVIENRVPRETVELTCIP